MSRILFNNRTTDAGTPAAGKITLYSKLIAGVSRLLHINESGTVVALIGDVSTDTLTNKTITGLNLTAGSLIVAPLNIAAGTNLTTASAGAVEYDGKCFYADPIASNRGLLVSDHFILQQAARATVNSANGATAFAIFDSVAGGTITLPAVTLYEFEMFVSLYTTGTNARTLNLSFVFAQAPVSITYSALVGSPATDIQGATTAIYLATAADTAINASVSAASYNTVFVKGLIRTHATLASTMIPKIRWNTASGQDTIVRAGSYLKLHALGTGAVLSVGNWS